MERRALEFRKNDAVHYLFLDNHDAVRYSTIVEGSKSTSRAKNLRRIKHGQGRIEKFSGLH